MPDLEIATGELHGIYRDVLRDVQGRIIWDRGWHKNVIVLDCYRLLAGFMRGAPTHSSGIVELQVGAGDPTWDQMPPPLPTPNQMKLEDQQPFKVPRESIRIDFLDGSNVSGTPTRSLQIVATLGQSMPDWPEPGNNPAHQTATLREFGLWGKLDDTLVLINYVRHAAIAKDPESTLERTIWLIF